MSSRAVITYLNYGTINARPVVTRTRPNTRDAKITESRQERKRLAAISQRLNRELRQNVRS